ncbi:hypothetical protein OY671_007974, partial [Metschnikowia pulcherrima]
VVDVVGAGVVQLVALEPDLRAAQFFGQPGREIEGARAADIVFEQVVELGSECGVGLGPAVFSFEIEDQRHQRFGNIAPAESAEMAAIVGSAAKAVGGGPCRFCAHAPRLAEAARLVQIRVPRASWPFVDLDGVRVGLHDFVPTFILRKDAVAREASQRPKKGRSSQEFTMRIVLLSLAASSVAATPALANEVRVETRAGVYWTDGATKGTAGVAAGYDFDSGPAAFSGLEVSGDKILTSGTKVAWGFTGRSGAKLAGSKLYGTGGYTTEPCSSCEGSW